ncbi:MAG: DUF4442 domain-containing protein [Vicingaceae bacterium]
MVGHLRNSFYLKIFLLRRLPMALLAGLKVRHLDERECRVSVPYNFLTRNPFKSMYFAVQSMAAEFSTALLLVQQIESSKENIALIIVSMNADFVSRAQGQAHFTCESDESISAAIARTVKSGQPETVTLVSVGRSNEGEEVSTFTFTWSVKKRG